MVIFNTTFHLSNEVYLRGLDYLRTIYIPQVMRSGKLHSPRMMRVVDESDDVKGVSLSVQFSVADMDVFEEWAYKEGAALQKAIIERFNAEVVCFSTILEEIEL